MLQNADASEDFDVKDVEELEPGDVLVAGAGERLERCSRPYDPRVAGVISEAGTYRPGIVLGRSHDQRDRLPVALIGRVYCKVDAGPAPIRPGHLLTTAGRPGHAMHAADREAAFGAVLGKALGSLDDGCATIPVLVALQ